MYILLIITPSLPLLMPREMCWHPSRRGQLVLRVLKKPPHLPLQEFRKKLLIEKVHVFIKGVGAGRESAVRTLVNKGLNVVSIKDITPIPHNGVKPKKVRRV